MQLNVEDFVRIDEDRIKKSKDYFMKQVQQDPRLVLWMLYCMDGYKAGLNREEFKNYLKNLKETDLRKIVRPRPNQFKTEDRTGVVFDSIFEIYNGDQLCCFFNIENQISYTTSIELIKRALFNLSTLNYIQQDYLPDREHYRCLKPVYSMWILPIVAKKDQNSVTEFTNPDFIGYSYQSERTFSKAFDPGLYVKFFLVGNEAELGFEAESEDKILIGLELTDLLYNFRQSKQTRLQKLDEYFGLSGKEVKKEMDAMSDFAYDLEMFAKQYAASIIEEKDKENQELKQQLFSKDRSLEEKDKEIYKLKQRIQDLELQQPTKE